jgi:hypothetical protein
MTSRRSRALGGVEEAVDTHLVEVSRVSRGVWGVGCVCGGGGGGGVGTPVARCVCLPIEGVGIVEQGTPY